MRYVIPDNLGAGLAVGTVVPDKITVALEAARFDIAPSTVNNVGAPWNDLLIVDGLFNLINGAAISGTGVELPQGIYTIDAVVNYFDDNSARASHRQRLLINGAEYSSHEGHNYLRDHTANAAINHDSAANVFPDIFRVQDGDIIAMQAQANSTVTNTTDVTGGWVRLLKVA